MSLDDSFMVLTTPPPVVNGAGASGILREHYGLEGQQKLLVSERDLNFVVFPESGDPCVLKIANSAEHPGVTAFQTAALMHVAKTDPDLPVPRIRKTNGGATEVSIRGDDDRQHTARVLSWLDGIPLRFAESRPQNAEALGALLARLGIALQGFDHAASEYSLLWDLKGASELSALLDHIPDEALRKVCSDQLQRFEKRTEPALKKLRSQVIYNDLNPSNVLVDENDHDSVTGIIDFGDLVRSPLVVDVAVAAAYLCRGDDLMGTVFEFLRGYSQVQPLQIDEVALLYELILTRNVMTIAITHWRASQYSDNRDYILRNEPIARKTIDELNSIGHRVFTETLSMACHI